MFSMLEIELTAELEKQPLCILCFASVHLAREYTFQLALLSRELIKTTKLMFPLSSSFVIPDMMKNSCFGLKRACIRDEPKLKLRDCSLEPIKRIESSPDLSAANRIAPRPIEIGSKSRVGSFPAIS